MVRRIVVGAHYGMRDWLAQRVSAVLMALYTLMLLAYLLTHPPTTYAAWKELFSHDAMRIFTLLFFLSLYYHAWVGMRDILMDYARPTGLRLVLEIAVLLVLVGFTIWTVSILWAA